MSKYTKEYQIILNNCHRHKWYFYMSEWSYEFYVLMYIPTIMPNLECETIQIFHWIEKFPRYDTEKAHIQSTMNRII